MPDQPSDRASAELRRLLSRHDTAAHEAALSAYHHARADGLCHDGALEIALTAAAAAAKSPDAAGPQ